MTLESDLYPLVFQPIYKQKIWGGRALERLGRVLPGDSSVAIGESWELADLATTSVSGGGGNAAHSVVANGPLAGKTIRELIETYGERLLGKGVAPSADGGFPLLIKFLDAKENLSVQVHPSPEYAAAHPEAHLKSEAWYIVDAEPGAVIYKGIKPGTTPDQLRAAIEANTDDAVVPLLSAVPAVKGDCHYLPSGTLHALGAGVLVAEVQTPSDTTFRVYDWGRTDRELHVEQAMACIEFGNPTPPIHHPGDPAAIAGLACERKTTCDHFVIDELAGDGLGGKAEVMLRANEIWIALAGESHWSDLGATHKQWITAGQTVCLPAAMTQHLVCLTWKKGSRWLRVSPPLAR